MNLPEMPSVVANAALKALNTFGLQAHAAHYVQAHDLASLVALLRSPWAQAQPKTVLGGGSNVLLVGDVPGLMIHNKLLGRRVVREDAHSVVVALGGGEVWHEAVVWTIEQGWGGLENMSLIPGSVGAAPIQNIGAYGVELKDVFVALAAMDLQTGDIRRFEAAECAFGYRDSVFKRELRGRYLIAEVELRLSKAPHVLHLDYGAIKDELAKMGKAEPTIADVSAAVIAIRQSKLPDPARIGNAGSFFKNPELPLAQFEMLKAQHPGLPGYVVDDETMKVPAGWLIEQAGWKGRQLPSADAPTHGVHTQQALVLVHHGGASGAELLALSDAIMADIHAKYGIRLEREVNLLGVA